MQGERLNTGRTLRIGMVFLSITAFWQMYNNVVPLILTKTFRSVYKELHADRETGC